MAWVATAVVGGSVLGGVIGAKGAKDAANISADAGKEGIEEQRAARLAFEERTQPFLDIGLDAGEELQSFLSNPNASLDQINPVASFLQEQGFRSIREGAAGGGRNPDQDLSRFQTGLTSTLVPQFQNQRFNQLFNVLGLGQNAAVGQGNAALQTGANVSNLLGSIGQAQAQGVQGRTEAITGGIQNLTGALGAFGSSRSGGWSGGGSGGFNPLAPNLFRQSQNQNLLQTSGATF